MVHAVDELTGHGSRAIPYHHPVTLRRLRSGRKEFSRPREGSKCAKVALWPNGLLVEVLWQALALTPSILIKFKTYRAIFTC